MTYDAYDNTGGSKKDVAQQEAGAVKDTAISAGQDVKDTAVGEAADLKDHAVDRAQDLVAHSKDQIGNRLSEGQNQLAQFVSEISDELRQMAHQGGNGGYASDIAGQLASRGHQVASYLSSSEPNDVMNEVRRYAARRPVAFLGLSLAAGVIAGRLVRGIQASQSQGSKGQLGTGRVTTQRSQFASDQQFSSYDSYAPGTQTTYPAQQGYQPGYQQGGYDQMNRSLGGEEFGSGLGRDEFGAPTQPRAEDDFRGGQL